MGNSAIEFNNVWKKFSRGEHFDSLRDLIPSVTKKLFAPKPVALKPREFWALQDVSFQVGRGDALGIIGPNGSGKSTILKLLSKILKADKGSLKVIGRMSTLIELGAGFHPDLTGRENIYLNGTILGMKRAEIDKKFDQIVEFSELSDSLDTPVKRYSSGMHARLGFAVAAHVDPEVLIIDEVLSVGDYHFQEKCFSKMTEFVQKGATLVFVSHNLTAISTLCKSVLVLKYGVPVFQGGVSAGIQKYHSFYDEDTKSNALELIDVRMRSQEGEERDVFDPGEKATFEVEFKALMDIRNAHAGIQIHTADGQLIFVTATSRLTDKKLTLARGESARISFSLDMNMHGNVFLFGFVVTPEIEIPGEWLYYNPRLKKIVMTDG
ncbi:MAG TPA: ABC transporter ATP-binding protein, partial [Acidobacteriaceae bacterium]|nr:ABC transporter ATP-binding protein [Acidobacteriaceae bacterium]